MTQLRQGPRGWTVGAALQTPELFDAVVYAAPAYSLDEIDLDLAGAERLSTLSSIVHPPVAVLASASAANRCRIRSMGLASSLPKWSAGGFLARCSRPRSFPIARPKAT